uniref:AAA+ ATPase At3g28540-like C-terminal domain-containing protein n=1 Tax=Brassica oleracea var. oleracea TaxID=109376 RepID=A0A0D3C155_BRAOL
MNTSPIEKLVLEVSATPAEVTQQLMASKDADIAFKGLLEFLETKKIKKEEDTKWRKQRLPYLKYRGEAQKETSDCGILEYEEKEMIGDST